MSDEPQTEPRPVLVRQLAEAVISVAAAADGEDHSLALHAIGLAAGSLAATAAEPTEALLALLEVAFTALHTALRIQRDTDSDGDEHDDFLDESHV